jgi:hypothetical protein
MRGVLERLRSDIDVASRGGAFKHAAILYEACAGSVNVLVADVLSTPCWFARGTLSRRSRQTPRAVVLRFVSRRGSTKMEAAIPVEHWP